MITKHKNWYIQRVHYSGYLINVGIYICILHNRHSTSMYSYYIQYQICMHTWIGICLSMIGGYLQYRFQSSMNEVPKNHKTDNIEGLLSAVI